MSTMRVEGLADRSSIRARGSGRARRARCATDSSRRWDEGRREWLGAEVAIAEKRCFIMSDTDSPTRRWGEFLEHARRIPTSTSVDNRGAMRSGYRCCNDRRATLPGAGTSSVRLDCDTLHVDVLELAALQAARSMVIDSTLPPPICGSRPSARYDAIISRAASASISRASSTVRPHVTTPATRQAEPSSSRSRLA
jgi:hypothetical protein